MKERLRAKATLKVTDCSVNYKGSLTLDRAIMDELGVEPYDAVEVNGRDKPVRIKTYIIPGEKGDVAVNGGAAQFFEIGDVIHLNFFHITPFYKDPIIL